MSRPVTPPPTRARVWAARVVFGAAVLLFFLLFGWVAGLFAMLLSAVSCMWMPTELNRHSFRIERDP